MSKWYLYENDEVIGPFTKEELAERLDPGTLVCEAGAEDWEAAEEVPELKSLFTSDQPDLRRDETGASESEEEATSETDGDDESEDVETIEPTLENLKSICERAENDDLMEQYEQHWDEYDAEERRVILTEIDNRGLME